MHTVRNAALLAALAIGGACGGAGSSGSTEPLDSARNNQPHDMTRMGKGAAGHEAAGAEDGEMAAMPPEVKAFHDALAPRWHAAHGPQRVTATCAAVPELRSDAEAIAKAARPGGASATDWATSAQQLGESIAALDTTCKAGDAEKFEQAFAAVHERFHGVMRSTEGGHDENDKAEPAR